MKNKPRTATPSSRRSYQLFWHSF